MAVAATVAVAMRAVVVMVAGGGTVEAAKGKAAAREVGMAESLAKEETLAEAEREEEMRQHMIRR